MTIRERSDKIRILFFIEYLAHGGTEKQLTSLIRGINRSRYEPYLCCLRTSIIGGGRRSEALRLFQGMGCKKIQLDFISFCRPGWLAEMKAVVKFVKRNGIHVIQTYFQDPTVFGVMAGRLTGIRNIIACFRDMMFWREKEHNPKMWLFYRMCRGFIANSEAVKDAYMDVYKLSEKKIKVIYNGVEPQNQDESSKYYDADRKERVVGIVANLNREVKRVDVFLKAAAYVKARSKRVRFEIIGDGELRGKLVALAEELDLADTTVFVGSVPDVSAYLKRWDIGLISSDSEGLSNAVLEYMQAGLPVIATDTGGNREIVQQGVNGYLVPPGDHLSMGERILWFINEEDARRRIGENASRIVSDQFSMRKSIEAYERYYESLV